MREAGRVDDVARGEGRRELLPVDRLAPTAALLGAQIAVRGALIAGAVEPAGLDEATADLLLRLVTAPEGSLRGVDIGRALMINPVRTSRLIDRAENAGLVRRDPDPADRRSQRITLTAAGLEKARTLAPLMLGVLDAVVFERFTEQELATLTDLLHRLRDNARALGDG